MPIGAGKPRLIGDDLKDDLELLKAECQALRAALGEELLESTWPGIGQVVVIAADWDGEAVHGSSPDPSSSPVPFLSLRARDRVEVKHRCVETGLFYGTVVEGHGGSSESERGWFGGQGCTALYEVAVPLGPDGPLLYLPEKPPSPEGRSGGSDSGNEDDVAANDDAEADAMEEAPDDHSDEVEEYIRRHQVDDSAAQALRDLDPELQQQIIRKDLSNCRNPSAVLLSRIERVAAQGPDAASPNQGRGSRTGRSRSPRQWPDAASPNQGRGSRTGRSRSPRRPGSDFSHATPSAGPSVSQSRAVPSTAGPSKGGWAALAEPADGLEDFVRRHALDDKAGKALRELPRWAQRSFMEVGLVECRNPSAVVSSRIRAMWANPVEDYVRGGGLDDKVAHALRALSRAEQMQVLEMDPTTARNPSAVVTKRIQEVKAENQQLPAGFAPPPPYGAGYKPQGHGGGGGVGVSPASRASRSMAFQVEDFIRQHRLDESSSQALLDLPPDLQQQVVDQEMTNCNNPSAVVLSRIRRLGGTGTAPPPWASGAGAGGRRDDAPSPRDGRAAAQASPPWASGAGAGGRRDDAPSPRDARAAAQAFIERHALDDKCALALMELPPRLRHPIIETELVGVRNPSAVVYSRVQEAMRLSQMPPPEPAPRGRGREVEDFIRSRGLDDRVAQELRHLPQDLQREVLSMDLGNARNPSALVNSKIKALLFRPAGGGYYGGDGAHARDVQDYLARHQVDGVAAQALMELSPELQKEVMQKDLSNCRNASAVLLSRVRGLSGR